jgi:hypothetical protein
LTLLRENREAVRTILEIGRERCGDWDDANRIASRLAIARYLAAEISFVSVRPDLIFWI